MSSILSIINALGFATYKCICSSCVSPCSCNFCAVNFFVFQLHVHLLQKDLVLYEMNVRAFTADESSGLDSHIRGSYLGMIEKVVFACLHKLKLFYKFFL